jgi:hypothetical protein
MSDTALRSGRRGRAADPERAPPLKHLAVSAAAGEAHRRFPAAGMWEVVQVARKWPDRQ